MHSRGFDKSNRRAPKTFFLSTTFFHFSTINKRHCYVLKPSRRLHWNFESILHKIFRKILEVTGRILTCLTLFSMGGRGQKGLSYQFFPCNFWKSKTFSFNPGVKFIPSTSPKLLNVNQDHPPKKRFFWSSSYKIDVMITSLIQILELPNFGHMTTATI